jgi:hypothetical protein|tara:strand:- start:61 stop:294 length:234 start_codon:yes stop_codon:yes gene_type:complete
MKSRDFVIWIDGFIQGKNILSVDDIRHIKNKIEEVNLSEDTEIIIRREEPPIQPIIIQEPNQNDDIDFPGKPPNVYM